MRPDVMNMMNDNNLWIFAYGSLLWKPCFHYHQQVVGHIKGFKRRFFQGNTNLRGTTSQPGRVAILVADAKEVTWGVAYEIRGQQHVQQALEHLYVRENSKGGYHSMSTTFFPRLDNNQNDEVMATSEPFSVLCFTATSASHLYLGPADVGTMARQVAAAHGQAGPNSEYVLRTAEYVRRHIPEDVDSHLFELERVVKELIGSLHPRRKSLVQLEHTHGLQAVTVPV